MDKQQEQELKRLARDLHYTLIEQCSLPNDPPNNSRVRLLIEETLKKQQEALPSGSKSVEEAIVFIEDLLLLLDEMGYEGRVNKAKDILLGLYKFKTKVNVEDGCFYQTEKDGVVGPISTNQENTTGVASVNIGGVVYIWNLDGSVIPTHTLTVETFGRLIRKTNMLAG